MKRNLFIIAALLTATLTWAQEVRPQLEPVVGDTIPAVRKVVVVPVPSAHYQPVEGNFRAEPTRQDSLHLPQLNRFGQRPSIGMYPLGWGGWYDWQLHPGLNVNLGASVFAQFGRNAWYKGAGFQQNVSMMYALPLSDKLSLAVGGYLTNTSWAHDSWRNAGLNAVLSYRFDEHWEASIYAQKSLVNNRTMPLPLYDMANLGDRIGAALKYNFNPNFSIEVSVEGQRRPTWNPFIRSAREMTESYLENSHR